MLRSISFLVLSCALAAPAQMPAAPAARSAAAFATGVLNREQAGALLPASVFFRGQSATIQARNSAGIKFANGKLLLATMVDTSGYSSAVQQTYQAYLIVETPVVFGGQKLGPGAYGFGFIEGDRAVVMDIGGGDVLRVATTRDAEVKRATPLQILPAPDGHGYRLYLGRSFVTLTPGA